MIRARPVNGFGLLEALVALVLLAGTGAALFEWIGQTTRAASQFEQTQARAALQLQALALLESINPQKEPEGDRRVADLRLHWTSVEAEPQRLSVPTLPMDALRWKVALYRVKAVADQASSGARVEFEVLLPGLEDLTQAREASPRVTGP